MNSFKLLLLIYTLVIASLAVADESYKPLKKRYRAQTQIYQKAKPKTERRPAARKPVYETPPQDSLLGYPIHGEQPLYQSPTRDPASNQSEEFYDEPNGGGSN